MKNANPFKPKGMKQKMLLIFHNDGVLDLVSGIALLLLTVVFAFDSGAFIGLIAIPLVFYIPLKEKISIPRMGLVRFESETKTRQKLILVLMIGVFFLLGFVFLFFLIGDRSNSVLEFLWTQEIIIFGLLLGFALLAVARFMNNRRFYFYALLAILLMLVARFTGLKVWIALLILASVIETFGVYYLVRFTQAYPISREDE
jgi:hypothetical protein